MYGFVFRRCAEPPKLLVQLFGVIKKVNEIEPNLPHPLSGGGNLTIVKRRVALIKLL